MLTELEMNPVVTPLDEVLPEVKDPLALSSFICTSHHIVLYKDSIEVYTKTINPYYIRNILLYTIFSFSSISLFNGIINFMSYLMPKSAL